MKFQCYTAHNIEAIVRDIAEAMNRLLAFVVLMHATFAASARFLALSSNF